MKERNTDKVHTAGKGRNTTATGPTIKLKGMGFTNGKMEECIKETG